jgi:arogenate dehydrogenase (NADP+), plant
MVLKNSRQSASSGRCSHQLLLLCVTSLLCSTTSNAWDLNKDLSRHNILSAHKTMEHNKVRPILAQSNDSNEQDRLRPSPAGRLEELKLQEAELARQLAAIRIEKLAALRSRPLTIGIIGYGRFGQFIAKTFARHGTIVVSSRSDYTDVANGIGATYVPLDDPDSFLEKDLDVIILAVSILSFESTVKNLLPSLEQYVARNGKGPLVVDVLSVKEHARDILLKYLPSECDILCTHPMFGPDSGRNGWNNLNFVYEKTRVDKVVFDPDASLASKTDTFLDAGGRRHSIHEDSEAHIESMDRVERFLSIWEEEGCRMVPMSCKAHDEYAANSQFITHLMGRILGAQGLSMTPIDTKGFESVLQLVDSTTADSFELFYGLYKYNTNSMATIEQLRAAMDNVVDNLKKLESEDRDEERQVLHN